MKSFFKNFLDVFFFLVSVCNYIGIPWIPRVPCAWVNLVLYHLMQTRPVIYSMCHQQMMMCIQENMPLSVRCR